MGGTKRKSTKKENILDGFGNDQFINQMLQNNNSGDQLPELGLVDDLGMDTTDIKESIFYEILFNVIFGISMVEIGGQEIKIKNRVLHDKPYIWLIHDVYTCVVNSP